MKKRTSGQGIELIIEFCYGPFHHEVECVTLTKSTKKAIQQFIKDKVPKGLKYVSPHDSSQATEYPYYSYELAFTGDPDLEGVDDREPEDYV